MNPYLSLVTPVHNGASFIEANIRAITTALERLERPFEVIVVCDGCSDPTAERARALADPRVRVLHYAQNRGKGHAIIHGVTHARGRLIGWLDGDLDIAPSMIVEATRRFDNAEIDAVIGSKRHPDSRVVYPRIRRLYSWGFQILVRVLFRINVRDTQVGAKVFRRELLDTVAPLLLVKHYAFDLEVLAVGAEFGFDRIEEAPINLSYRFSGSLINRAAVRSMFIDTLAIAYRIHVRHWYVRQYASRQRSRVDAHHPSGPVGAAPEPAKTDVGDELGHGDRREASAMLFAGDRA
jgi:glycosyltransferase involved in cell wall biosynthesis